MRRKTPRRVRHRRRNPIAVYNRPRRRHYRRRRRNPLAAFAGNPRRYHRPHRRHRRNPPAMMGLLKPVMYAGLGFVGTKFTVNTVLPAINIPTSPATLTSIAAKAACAYAVAWAGEKFIGASTFEPLFLGGMASAIQDIITVYIAPSIPALAGPGGGMGAYYRPRLPAPGIHSYYGGRGGGDLSAEDVLS